MLVPFYQAKEESIERLLEGMGCKGEMWRTPRNGGHDDQAHPPIHPTKYSSGESDWDNNKGRVYEFIVRSFLA